MSEHGAADTPAAGRVEYVREAGAGISATFVLLTQMLTLGLIAYGLLGAVAVEAGVRAAFAAALFGNLTAVFLGGALLPNEIPRASTVLVFAAFVARLVADPALAATPGGGVTDVLFLSALCLALAGLIQVVFGVLRLGSLARFVPYPVVAGLMTGLAIALIFYELPHIVGIHGETPGGPALDVAASQGGDHGGADVHHGWQPWTLMIALVTIITVIAVGRLWPKLPAKLIGVVVGSGLATLASTLFHGIDFGPRLPEFAAALPAPDSLFPLLSRHGLELVQRFFYDLVVAATAIAVIGSLDSLLAAVGEMEGPLDAGHHPNRLLVALGMGNLMSAFFGGVPLAYSSHHALVAAHGHRAELVPSIATTVTLILLLLFGHALLKLIPLAVLAGVMTVIAFGLINRWAGAIVQRARRRQYDRELWLNVALVLLVAAITITFGLVPAVITGLILSMALFIAMMNRSLVRAVVTGETRASRRVYPPNQARRLRELGARIKLVELDGAIFFGTADRLGAEVQRAAQGARFVVLDLNRVTMIDASGALILERLARSLSEHGAQLLLAHISPASPLGNAVQAAGAFTERHRPDWFPDGDRALEWAERQLLAEAGEADSDREIGIGEFALMTGLTADELGFMKPFLDRQLLPARTPLFHAGQKGDRLYLLARGAVSIVTDDPSSVRKYRRVVTLAPGVIFGESAVVEDEVHSVTAIAEGDVVLWSVSRSNMDAIRAANAELHRKLMLNLLAHLASMLRMTAGVLREESNPLPP